MWDINAAMKKKLKPQAHMFELRDMTNRLVLKGQWNFVLKRFKELNGIIGVTHFLIPASWDAKSVHADIKKCDNSK
jgi:hypothetical protein